MRVPAGYGRATGPAAVHWTWGSTAANYGIPKELMQVSPDFFGINLPYPYAIAAALIGATMPWLGFRRFSLSTLLIATTLVAVALGLAAWTAR